MRKIERTSQFKCDYKRDLKSYLGKRLELELLHLLQLLVVDKKLPEKYKDHPLQSEYSDCRDCHLAPDLVL